MRQRAYELGLNYEEQYIQSYPYLSWQIHSGAVGYERLSEEVLKYFFWWTQSISNDFFLEGTKISAKEMRISQTIDKFDEIMHDLQIHAGLILEIEGRKLKHQNKIL